MAAFYWGIKRGGLSNMETFRKIKKLLFRATKIALGSSTAIYIATMLNLQFAVAAGSITLLTLVTTKWETLHLSCFRLLTFSVSITTILVLFPHLEIQWVAYGLFIFIIVLISDILGWSATISVNAVIGTHFLTEKDFSTQFILNELMLVVIGIVIAIILNLFHANRSEEEHIIKNMRRTEHQLQVILGEVATYLSKKRLQRDVWADIRTLENKLDGYISDAHAYQNNTFSSDPQYYIDYFEMRRNQCQVLHNLHYEIKKLRRIPDQAKIVSEYILYMSEYVIEVNTPSLQLDRLEETINNLKAQPLPQTYDEFENRALLYHILMDLEEFLVFKQRFVRDTDDEILDKYWSRTKEIQEEMQEKEKKKKEKSRKWGKKVPPTI